MQEWWRRDALTHAHLTSRELGAGGENGSDLVCQTVASNLCAGQVICWPSPFGMFRMLPSCLQQVMESRCPAGGKDDTSCLLRALSRVLSQLCFDLLSVIGPSGFLIGLQHTCNVILGLLRCKVLCV